MFVVFEYLLIVGSFLFVWGLVLGGIRAHAPTISRVLLMGFALLGFLLLGYLYSTLYSRFALINSYGPACSIMSAMPAADYFDISRGWPFIYIYIFVTLLTLVYCFAYNRSELFAFQFYIFFILVVGGFLFYVNSLVLFFFAYEAFLIPSFLILYNFAKTRKAVEAAFLMFF